ncbi:hypothetical protein TNCV_4731081 [Trichonephila clavipes]|nr:hypothetical protein TNCV_4731081 [Trichonephila clavipes]
MVVSGGASFTGEQFLPLHTQAGVNGNMLLRKFSLGPLVLVEGMPIMVDYLGIIEDQLYPYMVSVFRIGKGIFQQDSILCQKKGSSEINFLRVRIPGLNVTTDWTVGTTPFLQVSRQGELRLFFKEKVVQSVIE